MLYGIGPRKARKLIREIGCVEKLFTETPSRLGKLTGIDPLFFRKMRVDVALVKTTDAVTFHNQNAIKTLFFQGQEFPRRLNQCADAPTALYLKGNIDLNNAKFVSIVGTRQATNYGKELCRRLIASFVDKNIVVISGLALGIDTFVHRFCLEYNVPTIAVLGHGLDRIYPHGNRDLAHKITENGALITEFMPGTSPDRENFPKRNRIVAGMSDATIVVESKISGGSLITAYQAFSYDRDVFAFPGNVNVETSQGCNGLISQGKAHCIQSPEEFLEWMGWDNKVKGESVQRQLFPDLNETQSEIVSLIRQKETLHIDSIAFQLSLPISRLNTELFHLILSGVLSELPGKQYSLL